MSASSAPLRAPRFNPQGRHRTFVAVMWVVGVLSLAALAYSMTLPLDWPTKLLIWVLLAFIADEAGNWFGYLSITLGVIPLVLSSAPPEQWWVIFPLVATALLACLVLKHSGGAFVLPFAATAFAAPIVAAAKLAPHLDASVTFPANHTFQTQAFMAAGIGLGLSLLRQVVAGVLRQRSRRVLGQVKPSKSVTAKGAAERVAVQAVQVPDTEFPGPERLSASAQHGTPEVAGGLEPTLTQTLAQAAPQVAQPEPLSREAPQALMTEWPRDEAHRARAERNDAEDSDAQTPPTKQP